MERWQSLIDQQLEKLRKEGQLDNLPGTGRPLKLDDNPNTPAEMRLAYKILRENDLMPAWIMEGNELDTLRAQLLERLNGAAKTFRAAPATGEAAWRVAQRRFRDEVLKYNKRVLTYNLQVPPAVTHKLQLVAEREIQRALLG